MTLFRKWVFGALVLAAACAGVTSLASSATIHRAAIHKATIVGASAPVPKAIIHPAVPVPEPPPAHEPLVGAYGRLMNRTGADLEDTISQLRSIGVQFSRENFPWGTLEPRNGQTDWRTSDALMRASANQGLQIMPIIWGSPKWVADSWNEGPTSPEGMGAYANFVREVVARYGSRGAFWSENPDLPRDPITYYDLWNEPYYPEFWTNGPDPSGYARLFKQAVIAARPADPNAKFLLEGNTSSYTTGAPPFLSAMFNAVPDLGDYADGLSVHPYASSGWDARHCTRYDPSRGVGRDWLSTLYEVCRIEDERKILDANGASHVPLWITEIGWSTTPGARNAVSEPEQAAAIHTLFDMLRGRWRNLVAGLQWYDYQDAVSKGGGTPDGFGLVRADGTTKPGWNAFREELSAGTERLRSRPLRRRRQRG